MGRTERVTWKIYIILGKINSENLLHDAGSSNLVLCDSIEGSDGEEGRRKVQEGGGIYIPVADSC